MYVQLIGIFEICINECGIFSSLFLTPSSPNIGGEIDYIPLYTPLGVIIALDCICLGICPLFVPVPKPLFNEGTEQRFMTLQPQSAQVNRGHMFFPTLCLVEDRAEIQNGHLMP